MKLLSSALIIVVCAVSFVYWLIPHQTHVTDVAFQKSDASFIEAIPSPKAEAQSSTSTMTNLAEPASEAIIEIAQQFEKAIAYPETSLPILDPNSIHKYQPNTGAASQLKVGNTQLALAMAHYQYQTDSTMHGQIQVTGIVFPANLTIEVIQQGAVIFYLPLEITDTTTPFSIPALGNQWQNQQIQIAATLSTESSPIIVSTPVSKLDDANSIAKITSTDDPYIDGAWLSIPINVQTVSSGFYRVEGNLYDAKSNRPLVHLFNEAELTPQNQTIELKAHFQALKAMGSEGDYLLADLQLEQMPSPPDFMVKAGATSLTSIPVKGFPFDQYDDAPYIDEAALSRLTFLKQLSSPLP